MAKLIGNQPNQVPTNGDLGTMAYQDYDVVAPQLLAGRRNLIINGAMQVAQRGTSVTGITTSGYKTIDRWRWVHSETTGLTMSQDTSTPSGFGSSCKILVTTADTALATGAHARLEQHIEGQNLQALKFGTSNAESLTVSFWVKSNKTGSWSVGFYGDDTGTNNSQAYSINSADTWEYKTVTFIGNTVDSIDNDNGTGLRLWFSVFAGSERNNGTANTWDTDVSNRAVGQEVNLFDAVNNYWQITGVQLEVGSVATPFEHRSYGEELALCQRYYQQYSNNSSSGDLGDIGLSACSHALNKILGVIQFPVTMRANPTVSYSSDLYHAINGVSNGNRTVDSASGNKSYASITVLWTHTAGYESGYLYCASGQYIKCDAEL